MRSWVTNEMTEMSLPSSPFPFDALHECKRVIMLYRTSIIMINWYRMARLTQWESPRVVLLPGVGVAGVANFARFFGESPRVTPF